MNPVRKKTGFTLVEVLVAVLILFFAIIGATAIWTSNLNRVRKAQLLTNVASLLERKMIETEVKYRGKPLTEIPEKEEGNFGNQYPQYTWAIESQPLDIPDLSGLLVQQGGFVDETFVNMIKTGFQFLSSATKEVKVSVFVTVGKKKVEYSLTTYFVDYSTSFSIGGN